MKREHLATIVWWADKSVKNYRNLPINNSNPDLYNINAHTILDKNPFIFAQVNVRKRKYGCVVGRNLSKTDELCKLAI